MADSDVIVAWVKVSSKGKSVSSMGKLVNSMVKG